MEQLTSRTIHTQTALKRIVEGALMRTDLNWTPEKGGSTVTQILATIKANIDFAKSIATSNRGDSERMNRWRERHSRKQRFAVLASDTPCWLASVAIHALAMVIIGSLVGSQIRADRAPITLLMSTADEQGEDARQTSPIEIIESLETNEPASDSPSFAQQVRAPDTSEPTETNESIEIKIELDELFATAPYQPAEKVPADALTADPFPLQEEPAEVVQVSIKEPTPSERPRSPLHQSRLDYVVDQFIKFDIGKLSGRAGQRAHKNFRELGPEAIPALVRGLNKSAYISASCPVGVISSKLTSTVRESNDPEMLQYVLNHLGDDVSESAPHYRRIQSVRNNLARSRPRASWRETSVDGPYGSGGQNGSERSNRSTRSIQERPDVGREQSERRRTSQGRTPRHATQQKLPAQQLLRSASMLRRQGRARESAQILRQVVTRFPDTREARIARSMLAGR